MRRKPYTVLGIKRLQCSRTGCTRKADQQWNCCADPGYKPLCVECDIALNRLVLEWWGCPNVDELIEKYEQTFSARTFSPT